MTNATTSPVLPKPMATRLPIAAADLSSAKKQLLKEIRPLRRGLRATSVEKERVEKLCKALEKSNPTKKALASRYINGQWELIYTTSDSILGRSRLPFLRPQGPIYQIIDAPGLRARNRETWPFFSEVSANLEPISESAVKVQFDTFKIFGLLPFKAPSKFRGRLDTTFLDEELRISRGDKGNLFVLTMNDPTVKP